jgi:hypothetical protein
MVRRRRSAPETPAPEVPADAVAHVEDPPEAAPRLRNFDDPSSFDEVGPPVAAPLDQQEQEPDRWPRREPEPGTSPAPDPASDDELDFAELQYDAGEGDGLVRANVWATAVFVGLAAVTAAFPDVFVAPFVVVSLVLFAVGCVAFLWGFLQGIGRSREELVSLGGLFFLGGDVAPARVRRSFQALLAIQVVASVTAAIVRPFTPLAFGVLVPTLGIGLMALWGARHGTFPPRPDGP